MNNKILSFYNRYELVKLNLFFICIILILYFLDFKTDIFLFISGILSIIFYSSVMYNEYKSTHIKITPISTLSFTLLLMMGVSTLYQGVTISSSEHFSIGPVYVKIESLKIAYLMLTVGCFFQFLALQIFRPTERNTFSSDKVIYKKKTIYILFIIILLITKSISLSFLGIISNLLDIFPIAILSFIIFSNRDQIDFSFKEKRNFIVLGAVLIFLMNLIVLSKISLLISLLPVVLFYIYEKYSIKKIFLLLILFVFIYVEFIQPFVNNTRILLGRKTHIELTPDFLINYIFSGDFLYNIDEYNKKGNSLEDAMNRLFEVSAPALVYEITEQSGFKYGSDLYYIAVALIPRILWPDKPYIPRGVYFAKTYLGLGNSVGMSIGGELYWNFGWIGIIIGYFLLGSVMGRLWNILGNYPVNNLLNFTFYFILLILSSAGAEFGSVFIGFIQLIIMFLILKFIHNLIYPRLKTNYTSLDSIKS